MIKELIKLANHLDSKGLAKEADYLDGIIKASREKKYFKNENLPQVAHETGLCKTEESHKEFIDKKIGAAVRAEVDKLYVDEDVKADHCRRTFSTWAPNNDWKKGLNKKLRTVFIKVHYDLPTFITSNDQIANSAKKIVTKDEDLNPDSIKNQNKRSLERAKR